MLTPVYNGAEYLAECIESVLAQTYQNWDYTIVNNCSTDDSLAIALRYAACDPRIRVLNNDRFLKVIENHNHAIRQISPESQYCKFVFGDDWIYPTCIEEMVRTAEEHPSIGVISSYSVNGREVLQSGVGGQLYELRPPYLRECIPGREACRRKLLGGPHVFGAMTALLVRSDLIRKRPVFFNERNLHADTEMNFDLLQESDFGFVHQVLSFCREHEHSTGSFARDYESVVLGEFVIFLKYGPIYLSQDEYQRRLRQMIRYYYHALAKNVLRFRPAAFWKYHEETLAAFGEAIDRGQLRKAVLSALATYLSHPSDAATAARRWWSHALGRRTHARSAV
jgi:glycosyltransferase involved in cell wall biosynthesis